MLVGAIDDERTDIYIHIDRKSDIPIPATVHSRLSAIAGRIDVRWGHRSQIEAEYALFETAFTPGLYDYYHLISGTHFPLKPIGEILRQFDSGRGRSVLPAADHSETEIHDKLGCYNIGVRHLRSRNRMLARASRILWRAGLALQRPLHLRDYSYFHEKCANWVSLNEADMLTVIRAKETTLRRMKHTFCGDEIFIPAILHEAGSDYDISDRLLFTDFTADGPRVLTEADFDRLSDSGALFARKLHLPQSRRLIDMLTHSND